MLTSLAAFALLLILILVLGPPAADAADQRVDGLRFQPAPAPTDFGARHDYGFAYWRPYYRPYWAPRYGYYRWGYRPAWGYGHASPYWSRYGYYPYN